MRKQLSLIRLFKLANAYCQKIGGEKGFKMHKVLGEFLKFVNEHKNDDL